LGALRPVHWRWRDRDRWGAFVRKAPDCAEVLRQAKFSLCLVCLQSSGLNGFSLVRISQTADIGPFLRAPISALCNRLLGCTESNPDPSRERRSHDLPVDNNEWHAFGILMRPLVGGGVPHARRVEDHQSASRILRWGSPANERDLTTTWARSADPGFLAAPKASFTSTNP
jgi:hypothetical protein